MNTKYQYPWRYNNSFQILVDGADYFSAMLSEIKDAKFQILFESYLFQSGDTANDFITELCAAKKRGVEVLILLDEYGAKGLSGKDKQKLITEDIELINYNPVNFFHLGKSLRRDHRKLLVIDDAIAFIGGAGITDEFNSRISPAYWHDVMLKVKGNIVLDLIHSFKNIWHQQKPTSLVNAIEPASPPGNIKNKSRALISAGTERNEIIRSIISHIRSSKKKVWLTSPYFISSWKIRRALRQAARKGVDVRLVFPGPCSDHKWISYGIQRYYQRLLKSNIAIYEFQPRFSHAKIILCDDWFTIGSSNFDLWNQFLNLDVNIEIHDSFSHKKIVELFELDFSESSLVILNQWNTRSFFQHAREWCAGLIIAVLGFISRKFKR